MAEDDAPRRRAEGSRSASPGGGRPVPDGGQGLVEFGVVLGIAALVAVTVLVFFRPQLAWVLSLIGSEVDKAGWLLGGIGAL